MDKSIYTKRERTERNYTVHQAFESAKRRLKAIGIEQVCVNSIRGLADSEKITLEKLNELSEAMYNDSRYWAG